MIRAKMICLALVSLFVPRLLGVQEGGDWSPAVSGVQARFTFERGDVFNGTGVTKIFLELRNTSEVGTPIYLFYEPLRSIETHLYDPAGKAVPIGPHVADITVPFPFLICLPHNSTLRFDATASGYGVPKDEKALIGLVSGVWVIKKTDSSQYFLGGTFVAARPREPVKERIWSGTLEIPKAKVDVLE